MWRDSDQRAAPTPSIARVAEREFHSSRETFRARCYHFVLGLDVSSEACIAAYFGGLVANLETPRLLSELMSRVATGRGAKR